MIWLQVVATNAMTYIDQRTGMPIVAYHEMTYIKQRTDVMTRAQARTAKTAQRRLSDRNSATTSCQTRVTMTHTMLAIHNVNSQNCNSIRTLIRAGLVNCRTTNATHLHKTIANTSV